MEEPNNRNYKRKKELQAENQFIQSTKNRKKRNNEKSRRQTSEKDQNKHKNIGDTQLNQKNLIKHLSNIVINLSVVFTSFNILSVNQGLYSLLYKVW
jgi:hypothetical protein